MELEGIASELMVGMEHKSAVEEQAQYQQMVS